MARRLDPDKAPESGPRIITIFWTVGDSLSVDYGDLNEWEVSAVLQEALELLGSETEDIETE